MNTMMGRSGQPFHLQDPNPLFQRRSARSIIRTLRRAKGLTGSPGGVERLGHTKRGLKVWIHDADDPISHFIQRVRDGKYLKKLVKTDHFILQEWEKIELEA